MEDTKQFVLSKITNALLKKGSKYEVCEEYDEFINSDYQKYYEIEVPFNKG